MRSVVVGCHSAAGTVAGARKQAVRSNSRRGGMGASGRRGAAWGDSTKSTPHTISTWPRFKGRVLGVTGGRRRAGAPVEEEEAKPQAEATRTHDGADRWQA